MQLTAIYSSYSWRSVLTPQTLRVMKLTAILLLAAALQVSAKGFGQSITLSLKNASLEKAITEIEKQSGFSFVYGKEQLAHAKAIDLSVNNEKLERVLELVFKNQPLSFTISGRYIALKQKTTPVIEPAPPVAGREGEGPPPIDVHGKVINDKGQPIEGATVTVKGTNKRVATNANGEFTLTGVDANAVLVVSAVNIEPYEIKIGGKTELAISVKTKVTTGEAITVEVNTGYQTIPKERATGSFVKIDNELINRSVSTDILSRINGISSGLIFNTNRRQENDISIRGRSTIFANDKPLIVVDNFAYDGDINNINPNDIESINILKDAAAASIWGARAGNGVIVIVTKKGRYNQPLRVELNNNVTFGEKPDLFYSQNYLNSSDFIDVETTLFNQGYYSSDETSLNRPILSPVVEILIRKRDGFITPAEADAHINALRGNDVRNDLTKYIHRTSVNQQHSINLNGGSENISYNFSLGLDNNLLTNIGNYYKRYTVNTLNNFRVTKSLIFTAGLNYVQSENQRNNPGYENISSGNNKALYPYAQLADQSGNALPIFYTFRNSFVTSQPSQMLNWQYNPIDEIKLADNRSILTNTKLNLGIKYSILRGLDAEIKYQYEKQNTSLKNHRSQETYYSRDLINRFTEVSGSTYTRQVPIGGVLDLSTTELRSHTGRGQLNFNRTWNQINEVNAVAGVEVKESIINSSNSRYYGYNDDLATSGQVDYITFFPMYYNTSNFETIPSGSSLSGFTDRFISTFFNGSYTYKKRYTVSGSARKDASNLFGVKTNQKGVPLWSAGVLWNISNENFYNTKFLPILKLRATYGVNGNIDKSVTAYLTAIAFSFPASQTGLPYGALLTPPNKELRWEKVKTINLGVDFESRNKIISGSIEYYIKSGSDLLGDEFMAPSSGILQVRGNFAKTKTQGVDLVLNSVIINKKFKWDVNFLFSHIKEKVISYDVKATSTNYLNYADNGFILYPLEGKPLFAVYSLRWGGLDPVNGDPQGYNKGNLSKDYNAIMSNTTPEELIYHGSATPTAFGGLRNNFSFAGVTISANMVYKFGYYIRTPSIYYNRLYSGWSGHSDFAKRWQKPGDETFTNVPSMPTVPFSSNRDVFYTFSEVLVEKGDHIRLQDISISYQLNNRFLKKTPLKNILVYAYANNLGIIWRANKNNIDPDISSYPSIVSNYPNPKTIAFGIKTTF